jgi:hypothetical protein
MSDELVSETGDPAARIPVDKMDADVVYAINPREVKYDPRTIADAAKIFYAAGENWTMPSEGWDQTNFGLFSGDDDLGGLVVDTVFVLELLEVETEFRHVSEKMFSRSTKETYTPVSLSAEAPWYRY